MRCRCGAHHYLPAVHIDVLGPNDTAAFDLCPACTIELRRFMTNEVTFPTTLARVFDVDDDPDEYDDVSLSLDLDDYDYERARDARLAG